MGHKAVKTTASILLIFFSSLVLMTYIFEQLFPFIHIGLATSSILIVVGYFRSLSFQYSLSLYILMIASLLTYMAGFPPSVIGTDSNWLVLWAQSIIELGAVNDIGSNFYQSAPLFFILVAIPAIILDISVREGLLIYPILIAITIPITVAVIVRTAFQNKEAALISAILAGVAGQTIMYSFQQIPQVLSIIYWLSSVFIGIMIIQQSNWRFISIYLILLLSSIFTHKFSVVIFVMTVGLYYTLYIGDSAITSMGLIREQTGRNFGILTLVSGVVLFAQWEFVTNYTNRAVRRTLEFGGIWITLPASEGSGNGQPFPHASPLNADILSILSFSIHIVSFLGLGAIAWFIIFKTNYKDSAILWLLIAAAFSAAISVLGIFYPIANGRFHLFAEPVLATLIGTTLAAKINRKKAIIFAIITLFIILQVFAAPASPDYPGQPREFLNQEEMHAKTFGESHQNEVRTDSFYAMATTTNHIHSNSNPDIYKQFDPNVGYGRLGHDNQCVSYRKGVSHIHDFERTTMIITWDFFGELELSFDRIYSSGSTTIHCD